MELTTMTYAVTGRIARITLNRPERGNGITLETRASSPRASSAPTSIRRCTSSRWPATARASAAATTSSDRAPRT